MYSLNTPNPDHDVLPLQGGGEGVTVTVTGSLLVLSPGCRCLGPLLVVAGCQAQAASVSSGLCPGPCPALAKLCVA
jgi:hypothetical protein